MVQRVLVEHIPIKKPRQHSCAGLGYDCSDLAPSFGMNDGDLHLSSYNCAAGSGSEVLRQSRKSTYAVIASFSSTSCSCSTFPIRNSVAFLAALEAVKIAFLSPFNTFIQLAM